MLMLLVDRGLGLLLDHLYSKVKTGQTGGKINYYLSKSSLPPLLIMGNSRALYQVIPDSLGIQSFNLAHAGMSQIFQTGLISILKDAHKMPPLILLHLEPEEFTIDDNGSDIQNLKYYYGKNTLVTQYISRISIFESSKFNFQLYRYNGRVFTLLKNLIQSTLLFKDYNGYDAILASPKDSLHTIYSSHALKDIENVNLNPRQLSYLLAFISICKQSKTTLICFTSPMYRQPKNLNVVAGKLNVILKSQGIRYINFIQNPIETLKDKPSLWKDVHHLNDNGAIIETRELRHQIQN
jgi:hypothetical protein